MGQWIRRSWNTFTPFKRDKRGQALGWSVDADVTKIKEWIGENQHSLIVVVGPKGTAKREMVIDGVLSQRPKCVFLIILLMKVPS